MKNRNKGKCAALVMTGVLIGASLPSAVMAAQRTILACNDVHMWNQVYLDDQWWGVDVTASDAGDETAHRDSSNYSPIHELSEFQGKTFLDGYPEITAFAKELLVPGSTK